MPGSSAVNEIFTLCSEVRPLGAAKHKHNE